LRYYLHPGRLHDQRGAGVGLHYFLIDESALSVPDQVDRVSPVISLYWLAAVACLAAAPLVVSLLSRWSPLCFQPWGCPLATFFATKPRSTRIRKSVGFLRGFFVS